MSRGFFRLWLVLSGAWVGFLALMSAGAPDQGPLPPQIYFGPPVILFLIGTALAWAAGGFRRY